MKFANRSWIAHFRQQWFLFAIFSSVFLGVTFSNLGTRGGILRPELTIPYFIVPLTYLLIFLNKEFKSYGTAGERLDNAFNYKAQRTDILIILGMCYITSPLIGTAVAAVMNSYAVADWKSSRIMLATIMPMPSASGLVLCLTNYSTKRSASISHRQPLTYCYDGEDDRKGIMLAATISILGAILGCILTPLLMYISMGRTALPMISPVIASALASTIAMYIGTFLQNNTSIKTDQAAHISKMDPDFAHVWTKITSLLTRVKSLITGCESQLERSAQERSSGDSHPVGNDFTLVSKDTFFVQTCTKSGSIFDICVAWSVLYKVNGDGNRLTLSNTMLLCQCGVLFSVFSSVCDVRIAIEAEMNTLDVIQALIIVLLIQVILALTSSLICKFTRKHYLLAPLIFCGTHKSITFGVTMINTMYHGLSHHSLLQVPLLLYHSTQTFLGALLIQSGLLKK